MDFSKEILETIFSHQSSFIYLLDTDLRFIYANKPLLKSIKKKEEEVIGKTLEEFGYDEETTSKLRKHFQNALEGNSGTGEDEFQFLDGIKTCIKFSIAPVKNSSGKITSVSAMCHDVSDRKKVEIELNKSISELQKEKEIRESFIMAMTHDLRTPLTAAKLSAQIIQRHPTDGKAIGKFSARIIENVERTDIMIRDLLDSQRLKAGEGFALNIQIDVMNALLENLIEELSTIHGKRFVLHMNEMVKGYWDPVAARRVMENLLTNAVKYGLEDAPIDIRLYKENGDICISVHNQGDTLTNEEIGQLFIPFKRMKNAKDSGQKGWGIGLTLVQGIMDAHKGKVEVESLENKGTTFTVKFPMNLRSEDF